MLIKDVYRKNVIVTLKNDEKLKGFVIDSIDESDIKDIQIITE